MPEIDNKQNYTVDSATSKRPQTGQDGKLFAKKPKNETSVLSQPYYSNTPKVDPVTGERSDAPNAIRRSAFIVRQAAANNTTPPQP